MRMAIKLIGCFAASLAAVIVLMPHFIQYLKKISCNQSVSEYSIDAFKKKEKTPVMGGILFIAVPVIMTILMDPRCVTDIDTAIVLLSFVGYGAIGFLDDYLIVVKKNNDGLKPWQKFALQLILAVIFYLAYRSRPDLSVTLPGRSHIVWHLGRFYAILIFVMFTGSSNAVNLTDGMDGLAAGCTVCALLPFLVFAIQAHRLSLAIFIASLLGALLGYLRYNVEPARIFMGDTGSLALGAVLAAMSMILKKEILLVVIGGVFVIETVCVILQISSVKLTGKRIFRYTPIHYAFVLDGMKPKNVVHMFWTLAAIFALLGLWLGLA
jgi:phospho-N-acetylmuramoyl-pentapeptide-transferase